MNNPYFYQDLYNQATGEFNIINTPVINCDDLNVSTSANFGFLPGNSILETDVNSNIISQHLNNGELLIGNTASSPLPGLITNTDNCLTITHVIPNIQINITPSSINNTQIGNLDHVNLKNSISTICTVKSENGNNQEIYIPDSGINLPQTSSFILSDYKNNATGQAQSINSDLRLMGDTILIGGTSNFNVLDTSSAIYLNNAKDLVSHQMTDGQLMIGSSSSDPVFNVLQSSDNSIIITNGPGAIDLKAHNTYSNLLLTAPSNQIVIQPGNSTNKSITLNCTNPSQDRVYTFPDIGFDANFILSEGNQSINGVLKLSGNGSPYLQIGNVGPDINNGIQFGRIFMSLGGDYSLDFVDTLNSTAIIFPDTGLSSSNVVLDSYTNIFSAINKFAQPVTMVNFDGISSGDMLKFQINGVGNSYTIRSSNPSSNRIYSMFDANIDCDFVMSEGAQVIKEKTLTYSGNGNINIGSNSSLIIQSDSTTPKQILIRGSTDANDNLAIGVQTTSNYAEIQSSTINNMPLCLNPTSQRVYIGKTSGNFLLDVKSTGNFESRLYVGNNNNYVNPSNVTSDMFIVYGSGTDDASSDVLHIRENTNTNPKEIYMGYNTTNNHGVIQSVYHNISYTDLHLCPLGGTIYMNAWRLNSTICSQFVEGSFNPIITSIAGSGSVIMTTNTGRYQRLGNWVRIYGQVSWSSISSRSGDIRLGNLPYTVFNMVGSPGANGYSGNLVLPTGCTSCCLTPIANTTEAGLTGYGSNVNEVAVQIAANKGFRFNLEYEI